MSGFSFDEERAAGVNRHADVTACATCRGDRLVLYSTRADGSEEYAVCPDCSTADASYWVLGQPVRHPDPARIRERLRS